MPNTFHLVTFKVYSHDIFTKNIYNKLNINDSLNQQFYYHYYQIIKYSITFVFVIRYDLIMLMNSFLRCYSY